MKLKIADTLKNIKGEYILSGDGKNPENKASLGEICIEALMRETQADAAAPSNLKVKRWLLSKKIQKALDDKLEFVDIPAGDVDLIKDRMSKTFPVSIMGPCFEAMGECLEEV